MDPINYSGMLAQLDASPLNRLAQQETNRVGVKAEIEQRNEVRQLAQRQFDMKSADAQAYQAAVEAYKADPSPAALRDLGIRFPEHQKELQDAGDSYTASQKQDLIGAGFSALGALASNKPDLAIKTLDDRMAALRGSNVDVSHTQAVRDMIKSGDLKGATALLSYAMGGLVGADHASGVLETLGVGGKAEDRRADNARQDRQLDVRERATEASIARGEAASARAERAADRADRKAAGKSGSGGGGAGSYEWRVNPSTGKLQRRKR
jgi:hypothetical protein